VPEPEPQKQAENSGDGETDGGQGMAGKEMKRPERPSDLTSAPERSAKAERPTPKELALKTILP